MQKIFTKFASLLIVFLFTLSCSKDVKDDDPGIIDEDPGKFSVFLTGDSTMATYSDTLNNPIRGWGQMLHLFFNPNVSIYNHAVGGASTKSFINSGYWANVLKLLKPGDYVFIQFGHNDQKSTDTSRFTDPFTSYSYNLEKFISETRSKGANPVILSSIVRRSFSSNGTFTDTHGSYPYASWLVAKEKGVPFIDLQQKTRNLVIFFGPEGSKKLYLWINPGEYAALPDGMQDNTHLSKLGATEVCKLTVKGLQEISSPLCKSLKK
jgi:lysophospholipase L1-like esterase